MSSDTGHGGDRAASGSMTGDFTQLLADLVQRMAQLGASAAAGPGAVAGQWRAVLESGGALASIPVRQMRAIADTIQTQQDQVRALQRQLSFFDEQLTALEQAIRPVLEWGEQWEKAQQAMLAPNRKHQR